MKSARLLAVVAVLALLALTGSAASSSYTLKRGDSLWKVAKRFKIPVAALSAANGITDSNKVREGQKLTVPDRKAAMVAIAKPIAATAPPPPADGGARYAIQAGDTLSSIARRYNTTVADLVSRNGLKGPDALLREGRELALPAAAAAKVPPPNAPLCPVRGADKFSFSDSFGAPREGYRSHAGNDIFAARGTPVVAGVAGTVRTIHGGRAGIGYYLDGVDGTTYYGAHMHDIRVRNGARVARGEVIGSVGSTGNAVGTPAHLHFEVKPGGGASIDPYALLRTWCR